MDFVSLFKQDKADRKRGKYLSRLFGIFSEDIVRIWAADEKCHYEDLGRPSIRFEDKTYTLDFTFQHKQSRKVYIVEQKCEIEFQNYKFFILNKKEQLSHHIKAKKAFMAFLEAAKKNIISASNSNSSNFESGYSIGNYSYKMIDGEQLYYTYKDGEKKEVNRVSIPKDILKDFEKSADEYEDKRIKRKNILLGILLVIIIAGILIYFN